MLEKEFYIARLVAAGIKGSLTADEEKELNAWIAESEQNRERYEQWRNEDQLAQKIRNYYQSDSDAIYRKIDSAINIAGQPVQAKKPRSIWPRFAVAASIILAVTTAGYFLKQRQKIKALPPTATAQQQKDILPGSNKAFLTLSNGQRISLTDAGNGTIAKQAGRLINKTADGQVVYDRSNANEQNSEQLYNTIETPRGGQYRITLADGSKVWLNAASSLKYPPAFNGDTRQVELTGEAYFEIEKDKAHPFRVKTAGQTVEVLGTSFDVNSYADEKHIATTLIEGSVKVTNETGEVILKPGEQALNNSSKTPIRVSPANIDDVTDWRNEDFYLNRIDFRAAMRKIARWYDVDVIYDPSVPDNIESGGWISRNKPLSAVLKAMERTGQVHFKIDGKKVYVSK